MDEIKKRWFSLVDFGVFGLARPGLVDWLFPCHFLWFLYFFFSAKRKRIILQCLSITSKWSPSMPLAAIVELVFVRVSASAKSRTANNDDNENEKNEQKYCAFIDSIKWRSPSEETQEAATPNWQAKKEPRKIRRHWKANRNWQFESLWFYFQNLISLNSTSNYQ